MNRKTIFLVVAALFMGVVLTVGALGVASVVFAQTPVPPQPGQTWGPMGGRGMMGGRWNGTTPTQVPGQPMGGRGLMGAANNTMEQSVLADLAAKLGLKVEDINAKLAKGQTLLQIAQEKGMKVEDFTKFMTDAHNKALDKAVADKLITAEQAKFMKDRWVQMQAAGYGPGTANCGTGGFGGRMGGRFQPTPTPAK